MQSGKITAVVLAGGSGKRMGGTCKKQYISLAGKPVLYYSIKTFQASCVDEIILVSNEEEFCRREIIQKYGMDKVVKIVPGGAERFDSVYAGLKAAGECGCVLIHDGARPFLTQDMISESIAAVKECGACTVGVPVKDTIKLADDEGYAAQTLERSRVWQIQTPQAFAYPLILQAYKKILAERPQGITDDAMVIEYGNFAKVKLIPGSYGNIKITTPEDLILAEALIRSDHAASESLR